VWAAGGERRRRQRGSGNALRAARQQTLKRRGSGTLSKATRWQKKKSGSIKRHFRQTTCYQAGARFTWLTLGMYQQTTSQNVKQRRLKPPGKK